MFRRQFRRGIRTLRRSVEAKNPQPRIPVPTIEILRSQLANLPADQRDYLQNVLSTREDEVKDLLDAQKEAQEKQHKNDGAEMDYLHTLVTETLESASKLSDFGATFWQAVKTLADSKDPKYIELFSTLFEVAKRMPGKLRIDAIYLVGTYLYRLKKVRLDPVNEVEYLDALVAKGRPFRALYYWNSRKNREEVKDSVYWTEIGALYHLDAGLWHSAEELASTLRNNGALSPRLASEVVKFAAKRRPKALNDWVERFITSLDGHVVEDPGEVSSLEEVLQRVTPVTPETVADTLYSLVETRNWDAAAKLLGPSKDFYDKDRLLTSMKRTIKYSTKEEFPILDFVDQMTEKSGVLFEERFWAAWLCALARTQEQDQVPGVLDQLAAFKVHLHSKSAALLTYTLLRRGYVSIAENVAKHFASEPLVNAVMLRYYAANDTIKVKPFLSQLDCAMTAPLAATILEAGNPTEIGAEVLGLDNYCWRLLWAAARDKTLATDCRNLFEQMLTSGHFESTTGLVETVAQAFLCAEQDIVGAAAAVAYFDRNTGFNIDPLLAASIFQLVSRIMQGRPLLFSQLTRKELQTQLGHMELTQFLAQLSKRAGRKINEVDLQSLLSHWESASSQ